MKDVAAPSGATARNGDRPKVGSATLAQLFDLAKRGASGEFVCSCSNAEIHFLLQGGRIAWASDSRHRHAFTQHLREHAHLDQASIEAVVAECKQSKRPIGETLMEWNLATRDQVRAAIRHQLLLAIQLLKLGCDNSEAVFLERTHFRKVNADLHLPPVRAVPRIHSGSPGGLSGDPGAGGLIGIPSPERAGTTERSRR